MKFLHLADLHLDSPFIGLKQSMQNLQEALIQAPYQAFEQAVSSAIAYEVDVVVIAGDIYDSQAQTIYAQHFFQQQLKRLDQAEIPVVMIHGNHDYIQASQRRIQYPDNVHLLGADSEAIESVDLTFTSGETARFYGFSYHHRWIEVRKINAFPKATSETDYTIGLLHGEVEGPSSDAGRYAPFSVEELKQKGYHYWALGHIHQAQSLTQTQDIQYAGTPQGRHRNELGEKGGYLVDLRKGQPVQSEYLAFSPIIWQEERIACHTQMQASELAEKAQDILDNYAEQAKASRRSYILTLHLDNAERLDQALKTQIQEGELLEALAPYQEEAHFVALNKILLHETRDFRFFEYDAKLQQTFYASVASLKEGEAFAEVMDSMWSHPIVKVRLGNLSTDEAFRARVIQQAQDHLVTQLGFAEKEVSETNEDTSD